MELLQVTALYQWHYLLNKNGKILTIDKDKEKNMIAKRFFRKAKVLNKIILEVSNANDALIKLIKNKKI